MAGLPRTLSRDEGLTSVEAARQLALSGPNTLPPPPRQPLWRALARQYVRLFSILLWCAAGLAVLGGLPELAVAIVLVVLINGTFAFAQEYRAERAAQSLQELMPQLARVRRDGTTMTIPAAQIVHGDVVLLSEGDRVPADMCCLESWDLRVDESSLTGESEARSVATDEGLWTGTYVVGGEGTAKVTATGGETKFALLARLTTTSSRPVTPLEIEIHRLVRTIAIIAVSVGASAFAVMVLLGVSPSAGFLFAVGVAVALVPESMLPTVTLSLAIGAKRMARANALVRHLESVETLGSTTVICTDKTGTLTQNRMQVVAVWTGPGEVTITGDGYEPGATVVAENPAALEAAAAAALAARVCSAGRITTDLASNWTASGDPMEAAIDALAHRLGTGDSPWTAQDVELVPFDAQTRRSSARWRGGEVTKGAPETIFDMCAEVPSGARAAVADYASRGLRVLGVAQRGTLPQSPDSRATPAGSTFDFLGLVALEDPPRPGVPEAVAACRDAQIALVMITGDHPKTAAAIAAEIGLGLPDAPVLTGDDLPADAQELAALLVDGTVLARITPEDKLRVARALQSRGHVVAMTGDGVNDAPAIRAADIGIAMGATGTDVARAAADLVLLDDHFGTIVQAVAQGRATFGNARKFLTYHLTDNVAELAPFLAWALSGGTFPLALGVLQILAIDLGTDTLPAIALGAAPGSPRTLEQPPVRGRLLNRQVATRAFGVLGPLEAVAELSVFVLALMVAGWRPGLAFPTGPALAAASGAAFLTVVAMQAANCFACSSDRRSAWHQLLAGHVWLVAAAVSALAFAAVTLYVPAVAGVLGQAPPPWQVLPAIALAALVLMAVDALWKLLRRRSAESQPPAKGGKTSTTAPSTT